MVSQQPLGLVLGQARRSCREPRAAASARGATSPCPLTSMIIPRSSIAASSAVAAKPMPPRCSSVRGWIPTAFAYCGGSVKRSTMRQSTPRRRSSQAAVSPTGPGAGDEDVGARLRGCHRPPSLEIRELIGNRGGNALHHVGRSDGDPRVARKAEVAAGSDQDIRGGRARRSAGRRPPPGGRAGSWPRTGGAPRRPRGDDGQEAPARPRRRRRRPSTSDGSRRLARPAASAARLTLNGSCTTSRKDGELLAATA